MIDFAPKISVVIPYFNDISRIETCLSSVVKQKLSPIEIIIIDDCSSDSHQLLDFIKGFDFDNIKYLYHRNKINKNGAYSRNLGVNFSSGDFIAFLDADDKWEKDHLFSSYDFLSKQGCDFVYSNILKEDLLGNINEHKAYDIELLDNKYDIILKAPAQTNSFFFNKNSVYKEVKFNESLRRHQDYQFFLDLLVNDVNIKYLDNATSYHLNSNNISKEKYDVSSILYFWDIYKDLFSKSLFNVHMRKILSLVIQYSEQPIIYYLSKYPFLLDSLSKNEKYIVRKLSTKNLTFILKVYYVFFIRKDLGLVFKWLIKYIKSNLTRSVK